MPPDDAAAWARVLAYDPVERERRRQAERATFVNAPRVVTLLLWALLALGVPVPAQAAVALVQQSTCDITDPFVTDGVGDTSFGSNTTIGNLILVWFSVDTGTRTVSSVTLGGGGTYTLASQGGTDATIQTADPVELWVYAGVAESASTLVQVTLSSAVGVSGKVCAAEFSGQHATFASAIEDVAVATNSGIGNHDTGNVTTASAGSMLFGFLAGGSGAYTIDTDFTAFTGIADAFGTAGYDEVGAVTASFNTTSAGSETTGQIIIAIAPAAGGGGGGGAPRNCLLLGVCN